MREPTLSALLGRIEILERHVKALETIEEVHRNRLVALEHQVVAQAESMAGGYPETRRAADARLAAAAPNLYRAVGGLTAALDRAMDYIGIGWQPQDIVGEARAARDQAELFMAQARGEPAISGSPRQCDAEETCR